jgi:hypothetical protein
MTGAGVDELGVSRSSTEANESVIEIEFLAGVRPSVAVKRI